MDIALAVLTKAVESGNSVGFCTHCGTEHLNYKSNAYSYINRVCTVCGRNAVTDAEELLLKKVLPATTTNEKTVFPIIHPNGTAREDLIKQCETVLATLRTVGIALLDAKPQQKDYWLNGKGYAKAADEQYARRIGSVIALVEEFERELEYLQTGLYST